MIRAVIREREPQAHLGSVVVQVEREALEAFRRREALEQVGVAGEGVVEPFGERAVAEAREVGRDQPPAVAERGGMAEFVATQRPVAGAVLLSGALPLDMLGVEAWPAGVPVQVHYTLEDPRRRQEWIDAVVGAVRAAGADAEIFDNPGAGHLFTDPSLPKEYDPAAAELVWERVLAFCAR